MNKQSVVARVLAHRPVRYIFVGGWNTVFGYALFALFYAVGERLGLRTLVATEIALVGANIIGVFQAYFLYKYIVFRTPHHSWLEFVRFSSVYALQLAANLIALPLMVSSFHIDPRLGQAIVVPLFIILTYLAHHHISFSPRRASH